MFPILKYILRVGFTLVYNIWLHYLLNTPPPLHYFNSSLSLSLLYPPISPFYSQCQPSNWDPYLIPKAWLAKFLKVYFSRLSCAESARRSNQSILKEISPEYSLEGLMLKLTLQYLGHLMLRADSFEKTLMLGKVGKEGDYRGLDGWMASLTQWTQVWVNSRSWWWTGKPGVLQSMESQRVGHDLVTEQQLILD